MNDSDLCRKERPGDPSNVELSSAVQCLSSTSPFPAALPSLPVDCSFGLTIHPGIVLTFSPGLCLFACFRRAVFHLYPLQLTGIWQCSEELA